jgi:hypothetical protein|tara:strand:- start:24 stop:407 length:384 start_codon:yes stop_codon:yes gene_type:complete
MSEIVGSQISSGAYQKLQAGYENAQKFIEINQAKNRVMAAQGDSVTNKTKTPLLLSNNVSFSTVESVSVKLNGVKRNVLTAMNELPVEVNVAIADEIRGRIKAGNWPTNREQSNAAIEKMIQDKISL